MPKPTILIVSDSAHLDTGFGRVAREIGTGLVQSGLFKVVQFGWFHLPSDKMIPFRVIPTTQAGQPRMTSDGYGEESYDAVIAAVKPDLVLTLGDEWMVRHMAHRPRTHKLVGYFPIDAVPINKEWMRTFAAFDQAVAFGEFGANAMRAHDSVFPVEIIPHGVDTEMFTPLPDEKRTQLRTSMWGDPKRFVVGCVARNNPRKMLPRLIKAFRRFINPSTTCPKCGEVIFTLRPECVMCGDAHVTFQGPKDDAMLYLHTVPDDPAGHKLLPLLERFDLLEKTGMPEHMVPGRGVSDSGLNEVYNALDLHTIPTGGEGFGLPLLEGMAAGIPTLATHYSGHVDFMKDGAGEFIAISDFETCTANNGERALVDLDDYVLKLDRCYYEHDKFVAKWGPRMLITGGFTQEQVDELITGKEFLRISGRLARERAWDYRWEPIIEKWSALFYRLLNRNWAQEQEADPRSNLSVEVLT